MLLNKFKTRIPNGALRRQCVHLDVQSNELLSTTWLLQDGS